MGGDETRSLTGSMSSRIAKDALRGCGIIWCSRDEGTGRKCASIKVRNLRPIKEAYDPDIDSAPAAGHGELDVASIAAMVSIDAIPKCQSLEAAQARTDVLR